MIAIHQRDGGFTLRWIDYCRGNKIPYVIVDIFDSFFLDRIRKENIKGVLFSKPLFDNRSRLAIESIVRAVEALGVKIYPGSAELRHYDDKIAEKYLFESLDIPCCPTWVFYDYETARNWILSTSFPKVFKLRCGAASSNVRLVRSASEADRIARKMFGPGMTPIRSMFTDVQTRLHKHKRHRNWKEVLSRLPDTINRIRSLRHTTPREQGYVYFQEYLPGNEYDTRVVIIGERALAFRRRVRPGDFRASGSGYVDHDIQSIDLRMVEIAFESSRKIGVRCHAYDFVYAAPNDPRIIECSYSFPKDSAVHSCPGYWDPALTFHPGKYAPQDLLMDDFLKSISFSGM